MSEHMGPPVTPRSRWRVPLLASAALLAIAGLLAGLAVVLHDDADWPNFHVGGAAEPRRLQVVYGECADAGLGTLEQGDGGASLLIDTDSEYGSFEELACVLDGLGTSEATVAAMDSTTAMMGVQSAEEDGLDYRWSYHPDNGVNMIITESSD